MIRLLALALAVTPWLLMASAKRGDDPRQWTNPHWIDWRDSQIQRILAPTYQLGSDRLLVRSEVIARADAAYSFLMPLLADPSFLADPERAKVLTNFASFTRAQHWMAVTESGNNPTNALGMDVTDEEYWTYAAPYVAFPDLLKSQAFLKLMSDPAGYKAAVDMIDRQNAALLPDRRWTAFPFRSQFILSVDKTTYGRLLVLVPDTPVEGGKLLDRWISFAIATPELKPVPKVMSVSIISTLRDPSAPGSSKAFFEDYLRQTDAATGTITPVPTALMNPCPSKNCYDCHKSAVLAIRPSTGYRFDSSGALQPDPVGSNRLVDAMRGLILKYGRSELGHLDNQAYGPSLGPAEITRTDAFIDYATSDRPLDRSSYDRIRSNMNCSSCHDGFAKINYLVGVRSDRDVDLFQLKQGLVETYIEKGYMPPNNTLTPEERHALWECIVKEYLDLRRTNGVFVDWLKGE